MNFQSSPFGSYPRSFESTSLKISTHTIPMKYDIFLNQSCWFCYLLKSRPEKLPIFVLGQTATHFQESLTLDWRPHYCMSQSDQWLGRTIPRHCKRHQTFRWKIFAEKFGLSRFKLSQIETFKTINPLWKQAHSFLAPCWISVRAIGREKCWVQ